jgi:hypothetical protein
MQFAIQITNDPEYDPELWGPYDSKEIAEEVKSAFVGVPESASVIPTQADMNFTGRPE